MERVILVIGDTQILIDAMEMILASEGYQIVKADYDNIFAVVEMHLPKLILFDLDLRFSNARQLLKELKKTALTTNIPLIIFSMRNNDLGNLKISKSDLVFDKPFELSSFLKAAAAPFFDSKKELRKFN